MSGMGRVFSYENSPPNPEIPDPDKADKMLKMDDRMFHLMAENDFATNGNDGSLMYANTRWAFQGEWRLGYNAHHGYEVETHFGRYMGKMQWRSEERRVGKECVSTCRYGGTRYH